MEVQSVELIGSDAKFLKAKEFATNLGSTKVPALIVGESGTGKRSLCRFIHDNSSRCDEEFVVVDCSGTPREVENSLLGFRDEETGRFTKGALEMANKGTVVFDNIDGMDEVFQKKIYQIIQELPDYEIDIRLLATTTKNLSKYVGSGRFYRALYTHFANTQLLVPPLRERGDDIEILANHFCSEFGLRGIENSAMDKVRSYYWAHNITELKLTIESSSTTAVANDMVIQNIEIGERKADARSFDSLDDGIALMSLKEAEKLLIKKALIHTSENRTQAAKILGVSIRTLRNKINEYRSDGSSYFVNLR